MKRPKVTALPLPRYDYGLALQTAVSWLGDKYLLAQSVPRRRVEHTPFSWNDHAGTKRGRRTDCAPASTELGTDSRHEATQPALRSMASAAMAASLPMALTSFGVGSRRSR